MPRPSRTLFGHPEFLKLWTGQTVSLFGSQVTLLALPLTAILELHASAAQLGVLNALEYLPVAFVTLLAGVVADRCRRRPLLIATNIGRAMALACVPALLWAGGLSMAVLDVVAFLTGAFTAQFDVAYQSFLPSLVERERLVEGNSKLQASQSLAQTAGQGLGGVLVGLLTAPVAVLVDVVSYLVSIVSLVLIRVDEPPPAAGRRGVIGPLREGLRVVADIPVLRLVVLQAAWFNLLWDIVLVVAPLFTVRTLHMSATTLGLVVGAGSIGALAGSIAAQRVGVRLGQWRAMVVGMSIGCGALVLLPLGARGVMVAMLVLGFVLNGFGIALFNVHSVALRQSLVPASLIGRVSAIYRFAVFVAIPVGGLVGGQLAARLGARAALAVAAVAGAGSAVLFIAMAWRRLHEGDPDERTEGERARPARLVPERSGLGPASAVSDGDDRR